MGGKEQLEEQVSIMADKALLLPVLQRSIRASIALGAQAHIVGAT